MNVTIYVFKGERTSQNMAEFDYDLLEARDTYFLELNFVCSVSCLHS